MLFQFYSDTISRASRNLAAAIFVVGLMLIGFGILIIALPAVFAMIAATIFFVAGLGCAITAAKVYFASSSLRSGCPTQDRTYRENVRIRNSDTDDFIDI